MPHYSFSLVFFTILLQMVVGAIWLYTCPSCSFTQGTKEDTRFWRILLALLAVAFVSSTTHLSNPMNAPYALTQVSHSPLSREIWAFSIFGFLVLLRTFNILKQKFDYIIGLVAIPTLYIFASVYMIETVPLLDTYTTVLYFFATAFLLGGITYSALFTNYTTKAPHISTTFGFILTVFAIILYLSKAIVLMNTPLGIQITLQAWHFISLLLTGFVLLCFGLAWFNATLVFSIENKRNPMHIYISLILLLIGAVTLRMLFYLLVPLRIGM